MEDGLRIKQFSTDDKLKKHLESYFTDSPVDFLEKIPEDSYEFYQGRVIVIKGEVVKPKPVTIVKTFDIG